jgi:uroporphyrin-III C-methyltransferase
MGLHNLRTICKNLIKHGKKSDFPVAVISKGTTKSQKVVVGTLENIYTKSKGIATPALIVVGQVVLLRDKLKWF